MPIIYCPNCGTAIDVKQLCPGQKCSECLEVLLPSRPRRRENNHRRTRFGKPMKYAYGSDRYETDDAGDSTFRAK